MVSREGRPSRESGCLLSQTGPRRRLGRQTNLGSVIALTTRGCRISRRVQGFSAVPQRKIVVSTGRSIQIPTLLVQEESVIRSQMEQQCEQELVIVDVKDPVSRDIFSLSGGIEVHLGGRACQRRLS